MDIGLPGMTGYEVARRLRQQPELGKPLLVAVTGYAEDEARRLSREAGFDHHLVKPVDPEAILALLSSLEWSEESEPDPAPIRGRLVKRPEWIELLTPSRQGSGQSGISISPHVRWYNKS